MNTNPIIPTLPRLPCLFGRYNHVIHLCDRFHKLYGLTPGLRLSVYRQPYKLEPLLLTTSVLCELVDLSQRRMGKSSWSLPTCWQKETALATRLSASVLNHLTQLVSTTYPTPWHSLSRTINRQDLTQKASCRVRVRVNYPKSCCISCQITPPPSPLSPL